jgi:hypothetical protein
MFNQEAIKGTEDFWLFSTKSNQICASFDRQPKSNSTKRVVLAYGIPSEYLVPYAFPARLFVDLLELTENGSTVTVELSDDSWLKVQVATKYGNYTFVLLGSAELIDRWNLGHLFPSSLSVDRRGYGESCMYGDWDPDLAPPE